MVALQIFLMNIILIKINPFILKSIYVNTNLPVEFAENKI